jgi:hypothetical protein
MRPVRVSVAGLMGVVLFCGAGFAALCAPSRLLASAMFSAVLVILGLVTALSRRGRGGPRPFWRGFAACGWAYLLVTCGPWFRTEVGPYLITTAVLDVAYPRILADPSKAADYAILRITYPVESRWRIWRDVDQHIDRGIVNSNYIVSASASYLRIGHSLFTVVAAYAGGCVAVLLAARDADGDRTPPP